MNGGRRKTKKAVSDMDIEHILYIIMGCLLTFTNTLIFITIMIHKALRNHKEYALLGMLVFLNSLLGIGFVSAGLYRFLQNPEITIINRTACLTLPHVFLFSGTACTVSLLLPFIALDRLFAVMRPLFYYSLHQQYSMYQLFFHIIYFTQSSFSIVVFLTVLIHFACFSFGLNQIINLPGHVTSECDTRDVFGVVYKRFEATIVASGHFLAVIIYLTVIIAFKIRTSSKLVRDSRCIEIVQQRRNRIVQTFGLFAILTFLAVVLPFFLVLSLDYLLPEASIYCKNIDTIYLISTKLALLNPTLNVVIYALRHNEIYMGMKTMLRGQTMPDTTEQWQIREVFPPIKHSFPEQNTPKHIYSLAHYQMLKQLNDSQTKRHPKLSHKSTSLPNTDLPVTRV